MKTPDDEALLQRWLDEGHEIGSHSHTHPSYTALTTEAYLADRRVGADDALGLAGAARPHAAVLPVPVPAGRRHAREGRAPCGTRSPAPASATCRSPSTAQDWSFDRPWADGGRRAATPRRIDDVRQDYLAAIRVAVTRTEALADRLLGRPAPQVLLIHANGVGAANWDAMFTWLAAHGHRFATADEVLADDTFRDLPIDPRPLGLRPLSPAGEAAPGGGRRAPELAALLETQAAAWNRGDLEAFCASTRPMRRSRRRAA